MWKLALACKGLATPTLLQSYDIERIPVVAQMLMTTAKLFTHVIGDHTGNATEQHKAPGGNPFLQLRDPALTQLRVNYRYSPIVFDARGTEGQTEDEMKTLAYQGYGPEGGVRAGDRAPQATGLVDAAGKETSVFDILKPTYHTLMVFVPGTGGENDRVVAVTKAAQTYPTGTVRVVIIGQDGVPSADEGTEAYHDKDGLALRAYRIEGETPPTIVVVRPDAYIGGFVYDVTGVEEYFTRIFKRL